MSEQRQRYYKKCKEETGKYVQASRNSLTDIAKEPNIPCWYFLKMGRTMPAI